MTNIVYVVPYLIKAGPISVLYNIVKHLNRELFTPVIVTLVKNKYPKRVNKKSFEDLDIQIVEYSYTNFYVQIHSKVIAKDLESKFRDSNTIFHAHGYYPTVVLSKMEKAIRITTMHNICNQDFVLQKGKILGNYMSYCYKRTLKRMDLCVSISDFMKSFYARDSDLNLFTVYNGVNEGLNFTDDEKIKIKKELGIPLDLKVLLCPAGFSYLKNQEYIINNVTNSKRKDFIVLFAGQGSIEENCKKLSNGDSRIRFLGYQMNLEPYWAICDFMVSASRSEGLPMAVLEAYVRGIPCMLSNIPPHKEIMNKIMDSNNLCFDINKKNSFKILLEQILNNNYDTNLIRSISAKYYTAKVMSENYSLLYKRLLQYHKY